MERHKQAPLPVCRTGLTPITKFFTCSNTSTNSNQLSSHLKFHQGRSLPSLQTFQDLHYFFPAYFVTHSTHILAHLSPLYLLLYFPNYSSQVLPNILPSRPTLRILPSLSFPPHSSSYSTFAPSSFLSHQSKIVCNSWHPAL